jgi:hypothetical protein
MNMIQLNTFKRNSWMLGLGVLALVACSKSDGPDTGGGNFKGQKYFIAATTGTATYLLTADDLSNHDLTISTTGNGVELLTTYTTWVNYGNQASVGLYYQQGNPGLGVTYGLATGTVNYPDSVWVAALDADLNVKRIYRDNRLSYSSGRFKSQYYSQIAKDDKGNVYVFSGSYDGTTTKPAGALRINQGAETFDQNYYFNIQEKSGGYRFRKVWHITEDYYLLEFYNSIQYDTNTPATQYAIVKMEDQSFTWLTNGFPTKDQITATGLPFADGGKLYLPVTTDTAAPTIYVIDPTTASASAGIVIEADAVNSVTKLTL